MQRQKYGSLRPSLAILICGDANFCTLMEYYKFHIESKAVLKQIMKLEKIR